MTNFVYCKTKETFLSKLESGEISKDAIVFIESSKQIWTHDVFYATALTSEEIQSAIDNSETIQEALQNISASIPTKVSQLENDSDFITNEVETLTATTSINTPKVTTTQSFWSLEVPTGRIVYDGLTLALRNLSGTLIWSSAFYTGHNTVSSIASIPVSKRLVVATISASASFSLANIPLAGQEVHVIVKNSSSSNIVVTLPNSGNYVCFVDTALPIAGNLYAEISVISDGSKMYIRAI